MHLNKEEIEGLERSYKLNLINSISGIKPANLIGTRSLDGKDNVAIFSSVVQTEIPRDTYPNIMETGFYTINHVSEAFIEKAHYTSAKLEKGDCEFERMKLKPEYIGDFHAPFVKESPVKIGMKHSESIPLPNGCIFVIGSVEMIICPDDIINDLGQMNLESYAGIGISGLNTYYGLTKLDSFPYVRENEIPEFK